MPKAPTGNMTKCTVNKTPNQDYRTLKFDRALGDSSLPDRDVREMYPKAMHRADGSGEFVKDQSFFDDQTRLFTIICS